MGTGTTETTIDNRTDDQTTVVAMGRPIEDPLRDAKSAAECAYLAANIAYYGIVFLIFGAAAATTYCTVFAGSKAAAGNNCIPNKIGVPSQDRFGNPSYSAVAHCTSIILGYVNS